MTKGDIVDILLAVAGEAANESGATHPEDIALAMSLAIDHAGVTLRVLSGKGQL